MAEPNPKAEAEQPGWTRLATRTGRYEYQFQGHLPTVRNGRYEEARDYQFLVTDEERWLYRIPVRVARAAEEEIERQPGGAGALEATVWIAEAQLRAGLEKFRPRSNASFEELDTCFAVDQVRACELRGGKS